MTRMIDWEGQPFALLVEGTRDGDYLVPPIVLDLTGAPIEGREVLHAIVPSGVSAELPVVRNAPAVALAEIDRRMARISEELGVPIGPPS